MFWENLVFDAKMPHEHGKYWEKLLSSETLTDNEGGFETRLRFSPERYLDLCFPLVSNPEPHAQRVFPLLSAADKNFALEVEGVKLAREERVDIAGRGYLTSRDPTQTPATTRLAGVELHSAEPERDAKFWAMLTGFHRSNSVPTVITHPSGIGPAIMLVHETTPKSAAKSSVHLDLRLEARDDINQILNVIQEHGGTELKHEWGTVPWRVFLDPSGNEFCILPALAEDA
ncbi:VOC family protein [Glutamicibacter sp.]|uniref:VOC family protein n=1 Tax=Glutamicibacter sp. TaxID=1931995 RepID=UPI002FE27F51